MFNELYVRDKILSRLELICHPTIRQMPISVGVFVVGRCAPTSVFGNETLEQRSSININNAVRFNVTMSISYNCIIGSLVTAAVFSAADSNSYHSF